MTPFQSWVCGVASIALMAFLFDLIRRRKLREEYSLLWLAACVVMLAIAVHSDIVNWIGRLLHTEHPAYSLFVIALFIGVVLAIHFSVVVSKLTAQNWRFAQEIGLLRAEVSELTRQKESQTAAASPNTDGGGAA